MKDDSKSTKTMKLTSRSFVDFVSSGLLSTSSPLVMGVINVTPDSFSDGSSYQSERAAVDLDLVLRQVDQMLKDGASLIDVGGESTRPGAKVVDKNEEAGRVLPVVEAIRARFDCPISVDTSTPEIILESARLGASLINDVRALTRDGALEAAAKTGLPVCLMHMQGRPISMQDAPEYVNVISDVHQFLEGRILACERAGIGRHKILVDPGFGFGKTLNHNLTLVQHLSSFRRLRCPVLVGFSRKSMIGKVLDEPVEKRLYGGLALTTMALERGAKVIRVHDVKPTVDAVKMFHAVSTVED